MFTLSGNLHYVLYFILIQGMINMRNNELKFG